MLIEQTRRGDAAGVRALLESGSDPNETDAVGATALHYAAESGYHDIARLLLQHGANVNARDGKFRATPAGWAIEYLREFGAQLGIELDDLAYAIEARDVAWVKRLLKRFPGLKTASHVDGIAFRDLAAKCGSEDITRLFQPS